MNERLIQFGPEDGLVGTITLPQAGSAPAPANPVCFVFFNAGFVHRVGPHRLNVRLARFFARHGHPAVRFDFSGLGDSARASGGGDQKQRMLSELAAAMTVAGTQSGVNRFVLVGLCSGTDPCIWAAMQDARVAGIVLLDPFAYRTWRTRLNHVANRFKAHGGFARGLVAAVRSVSSTLLGKLQGKAQPKAVDGGNNGDFIIRPIPPREEFEGWIGTVLARKVRTLAIYTGNFPAWYNYDNQFVERHGTFGGTTHLTTVYIPEANHTFTDLNLQNALLDRLLAWVRTFDGAA